jgi:AraC-like DNA-binding protein
MDRESTFAALQVSDLLAAFGRLRLAPTTLCRAAGLEPSALKEPAARLPAHIVMNLFGEAERRARDPFVGLHAAQRAEPRGTLSYLLMSSANLDEGLHYTVRFAGLMIDALRIQLQVTSETATLTYELHDPVLEHHHLVEYLLMTNLRVLNRSAGRLLHLREVSFRYADAGRGDEIARAFAAAIRFAQPSIRLALAASELTQPFRLPNPLVAHQLEKLAAALLAHVTPAPTLSQRVADVVRSRLAGSVRADRTTVARRLGMSDRTLERGLENEQTTFRTVRDAVLWEVVEALLANPALKIEAVALSAGFADVAAFSKAFKRWAGCSATLYRKRLLTPQLRPK